MKGKYLGYKYKSKNIESIQNNSHMSWDGEGAFHSNIIVMS